MSSDPTNWRRRSSARSDPASPRSSTSCSTRTRWPDIRIAECEAGSSRAAPVAFGVPQVEASFRRRQVERELVLEDRDLGARKPEQLVFEPPLLVAHVRLPLGPREGGTAVLAGHVLVVGEETEHF